MISAASIDAIRQLAVVDVVDRFLTLKRKGNTATACCPFHNEKSPSFNVSNTKGIYKCFGCGESGDGISFVMKYAKVEFIDAVKMIAEKFGLQLEYSEVQNPEAQAQLEADRQDELEVIRTTIHLYHSWLTKLDWNSVVTSELSKRGWGWYTIVKWKLGWGTTEWNTLQNLLDKTDAAERVGLIRKTQDGRHIDAYRSRITFPIQDHTGKFVGIGGRWTPITDKDKAVAKAAKYINSVESLAYKKSEVLYGLHHAQRAIKRLGFAFLVEGYADVISMHAFGDQNTVGTCGTALTDAQAKLLKRFTQSVVILRDGDAAGEAAVNKDIPVLLNNGFQVKVAELMNGMDPDDFIRDIRTRSILGKQKKQLLTLN
jgi:DNA primase